MAARHRVSQEEDYIEDLVAVLEHERAKNPDVILPWEWWRQQAERFHVTPNNIYSRAVNRGLYIPEARRHSPAPTKAETAQEEAKEKRRAADEERPSPREKNSASQSDTLPLSRETSPRRANAGHSAGTPVAGAPSPSIAQALTERLQAMADVAGLLGEMEGRIAGLERDREAESARKRETLRALDRLARVLEEASRTVTSLQQLYEDR